MILNIFTSFNSFFTDLIVFNRFSRFKSFQYFRQYLFAVREFKERRRLFVAACHVECKFVDYNWVLLFIFLFLFLSFVFAFPDKSIWSNSPQPIWTLFLHLAVNGIFDDFFFICEKDHLSSFIF